MKETHFSVGGGERGSYNCSSDETGYEKFVISTLGKSLGKVCGREIVYYD